MKASTLFIIIILLSLASCSPKEKKLDAAQETAFFYLFNPSLISDTFSRNLYQGTIDFRAIDPAENLLYFIFDKTLDRNKTIQKIARDTSLVEFAPCESGPCNFGGLEGNVDDIYALRIPLSNLNVDSTLHFSFALKTLKDSMSFKELQTAIDTQYYYGGKEYFLINREAFRNIGTIILKKTPSSKIYKLAKKLKGTETNREKIVQKLLAVVTDQIDYSYGDFWYQAEIMQRAHEVLLAGLGDCSGKTVLMASLLEQLDIPYVLVYYKNHINLAIEGNFPNDNGYEIPIQGKNYTMAETTCPNFKMGRTILDKNVIPDISYYQIPRKGNHIYDYTNEEKKRLYSQEEIDVMQGY